MNKSMSTNLKKFTIPILFANALNLISFPILATESGDWLVRGRLIYLAPNDESDSLTSDNDINVGNMTIGVDSALALDVDITYMIAEHWGVELFLDSSSKHKIYSAGNRFVSLADGTIANTRMLPPALVLQYHFFPGATIRPYAGVGANYTIFFSEKASSLLNTNFDGVSDFKLENSFGLVAQIGADYHLDNDFFVNIDLKYMNIDTIAAFKSGAFGNITVDTKINPWVIGFGVGRRF